MRPLRELLLGARMAVAGGGSGWVRAGLTAVGVGLGVAMLLVAVSVPNAIAARDTRQAARDTVDDGQALSPSDTTMLVGYLNTGFRDKVIHGVLLQPEGSHPPIPPGLAELPGPGEMVVSPALARLLAEPDAALLRERLDYRAEGTIGEAGLTGPHELIFYLGTDDLDEADADVYRRAAFDQPPWRSGPDPMLSLIVVAAVVVLLLPVALFVAAAIRFGGEARDRRLAGVRLLGADARMTRRVGAGEALASSVLGLLVGAAIFAAVRSFVDNVELFGFSAFPGDLRPDPGLTALLVLGVPLAAVLVTLVSLRRVLIEPLGVTRRASDVRRRVWWRALLPLLGLGMLLPLRGAIARGERVSELRVAAGIILLLVGVAALLPWAVEATVRRLHAGPVAWQLAVRRLQLDASTSARAVVGIAVAVAGAIGLQTVFASVEANYAAAWPQSDETFASYGIHGSWDEVRSSEEAISAVRGVHSVTSQIYLSARVDGGGSWYSVIVGECPALRQIVEIGACADGDAFILRSSAEVAFEPSPSVGATLLIENEDAWTIPTTARMVTQNPEPGRGWTSGVLATPAAVPAHVLAAQPRFVTSLVELDRRDPDAVEQIRNALWPGGSVYILGSAAKAPLAEMRRALSAAATLTLVLIGVSLLVSMLDQLRERRRVLAGLVAFGTRRRTLAWSVLWQAAVPVVLGLLLALSAGLGVGVVLLRIASQPLRVDWPIVGVVTGVAALVVLGVTALSTPVLFRLMRADGLRTE